MDYFKRIVPGHPAMIFVAVLSLLIAFGSAFAVSVGENDVISSDISVTVTASDDASLSIVFELSELEQQEFSSAGEMYDRYIFDGEPVAGPEGWPELPAIVRHILIPPQSGVGLNITQLKTRIEHNINPFPHQPEDINDILNVAMANWDPQSDGELMRDPAGYDYDGIWPREIVTLGRPAIMRGYRIIPMIIHPLRYNAHTGDLEVVEQINVELDFTSDENRVNLVENPSRPRPSKSVFQIVSDIVINPPEPSRDQDQNGSIAYVMGTGNAWDDVLEELEPLIEWRRRMGWSVGVIRVGNTQNTGSVKDGIREAYNEWDVPPEHVVLVGEANASQFIIAYWDVGVNIQYPYESDHQYTELEGDDVLPEVTVGRFPFTTLAMLRGIINKTVNYESDPFIGEGDDEGWQLRGGVASVDWESGSSSNDMCRWSKELLRRNDYTDVAELYWTPQVHQPACFNFVNNTFNDGISFFVFRGHLWMGRTAERFTFDNVNQLRNGRMLPFALIITCNTGDYAETISSPFYFSERFLFHTGGGAIGAVACGGSTHVAYNNLYCTGTMRAVFAENLTHQGWAHSRGLINLYLSYSDRNDIQMPENQAQEAWECHYYIFNLMGDPAVDLYTDVPHVLEVEHNGLRAGDSRFSVRVLEEDEEEIPLAGVQVCLYKPDGFQLVESTDEEGMVLFNLDPAEIENNDEIMLTVSGHNLMPYMADMEVATAEMFIGAGVWDADDDDEGESNGDGDGTINPTERIELSVDVVNYGSDTPDGEMIVSLTPIDPGLEVVNGVVFEQAPEPDQSVTAEFIVEIHGAFPNGRNARFDLTVEVGENSWISSVVLPIEGPELEVILLDWAEDPLERASSAELHIRLANIGAKDSPPLDATLISLTRTVDVPGGGGHFEAIAMGEEGVSEGLFTLSANPFHINGSRADLALVLESEGGFLDTAFVSFIVGQADDGDAFGPDNYGYICVDNTDEDWFIVPEYEWIEIDEIGEDTDLSDPGTGDYGGGGGDESILIEDLPFDFQFYGETYNELTICTNGWIAMGDQSELFTARNRRIPGGSVISAMICPFWDDLMMPNGSGIYTYFDEDEHIFIVEWKNMRKLAPGQGVTETFEVILYDPDHYPTFTGDGDIMFQYLDVTDAREAYLWDVPYATVGIGSPDQLDGIEYTYWGVLAPGAAPLEDGRAIRFTTMRSFDVGAAEGYVLDAATNLPIEGALVLTSFGYSALTDTAGYYFIGDMLDATELDSNYMFKASKIFYNDSTLFGIEIIEDETTRVDFALLHPEFGIPDTVINVALRPNTLRVFDIPLVNSGNGTLTFNSYFDFRPMDRDDPFDQFMQFDVSRAIVEINGEDTVRLGNLYNLGTVFTDTMFYVSAGGDDADSLYAKFYRFNRNGTFIDSLSQPWIHNRGIRGMAWDGEYIWGGHRRVVDGSSQDAHLYKFDHEGELIDSIACPNPRSDTYGVAFDRQERIFYICGLRTDIWALDEEGNEVDSWGINYNGRSFKQYGLAWYPDQPDSLKLLIFGQVGNETPELYGFNPNTGELEFFRTLEDIPGDKPMGIDVTDRWNTSVWTLVTVLGAREDHISLWELHPNTTWLSYTPVEATMEAGQDTVIHIEINGGDRPIGQYWVFLQYEHNAEPGMYEIPIMLEIDTAAWVDEEEYAPVEYGLHQNFPNPFNPVTTIGYRLVSAGYVELTLWDVTGRQVATLVDDHQPAGFHRLIFDASGLPNGVYIYRLEASGMTEARKMVLIK